MSSSIVGGVIKALVDNVFKTRPNVNHIVIDPLDSLKFIVRDNGNDYLVSIIKIVKEIK